MIPSHIQKKLRAPAVRTTRQEDPERVKQQLAELGIGENTEIYSFMSNFFMPLVMRGSNPELLDVIPVPSMQRATDFIHKVWSLPEHLVCISSPEGEGGFLFDLRTGSVLDFNLAERVQLMNGSLQPRWNSFFEFLDWYLNPIGA